MNLQDNPRITLVRYDDPAEWNEAVASEMVDLLEQEISRRGQARMLLSGGTTPAPVYESLAHHPLDWSRVEVGLVDERWLSPQDQDSNAWLVNHSFLTHARAATFIPLVRPGKQLPECVHTANLQATHAEPACLAVLGMGGDG
ncbi:6-phosphogluconolactonase, partial [Xanthomonas oryzae pv. oryzae]